MTEPEYQATLCNGCGATDDHPKVHVWGNWAKNPEAQEVTMVRDPSFHFDCLPDQWADHGGDPSHANLVATREAALSGVHGQELRDHIATLPDDNVEIDHG